MWNEVEDADGLKTEAVLEFCQGVERVRDNEARCETCSGRLREICIVIEMRLFDRSRFRYISFALSLSNAGSESRSTWLSSDLRCCHFKAFLGKVGRQSIFVCLPGNVRRSASARFGK